VISSNPVGWRSRFSQPDVENNKLILLDSEIPKPHKPSNFDRFAAFYEISPGWPLFICAAALILAGQPTQGQAPPSSAQERARLLGQGALPGPTVAPPAEVQGYAVASPNERDFGEQQILKRTEEYRPFTVSVYSPFYWTSNAALVGSGEQDDVLERTASSVSAMESSI